LARPIPRTSDAFSYCDDLLESIRSADRPDLLVIGPATSLTPIINNELANYVGRIFLMGGSIAGAGNATATAEFNFWFDPEAAEALLGSNVPLTLLPLDAIRTLHYSQSFAATVNPHHPSARYILTSAGSVAPPPICDELLAAVIVDPAIIAKSTEMRLTVETNPGPRYGAVAVLHGGSDRRPVEVIEKIDEARFWDVAKLLLAEGVLKLRK